MKKRNGTIRSKGKNGNLCYRLTIASGVRKEFPLKTKNEAEAIPKAGAPAFCDAAPFPYKLFLSGGTPQAENS